VNGDVLQGGLKDVLKTDELLTTDDLPKAAGSAEH
jgi:hypothetical protein